MLNSSTTNRPTAALYRIRADLEVSPPGARTVEDISNEVWQTVSFARTRVTRWSSEYWQTRIDAPFGVLRGRT